MNVCEGVGALPHHQSLSACSLLPLLSLPVESRKSLLNLSDEFNLLFEAQNKEHRIKSTELLISD